MSHAAVLVVGNNIANQMAPFEESAGSFFVNLNITKEALAKYNESTEELLEDPSGKQHTKWTEDGEYKMEFLREPTEAEQQAFGPYGSGYSNGLHCISRDFGDGRGYRSMIHFLPEGWKRVKVPSKDIESFKKWAEEYYGYESVPYNQQPSEDQKYGYIQLDESGEVEKIIERTNPNAKWDWYIIGGRWNGFFKLKPEYVGLYGCGSPGLQSMEPDYEEPGPDRADQAIKGAIDIEGMRNEAGERAAKKYDKFAWMTAGLPALIPFEKYLEEAKAKLAANPKPALVEHEGYQNRIDMENEYDIARTLYHQQPILEAMKADKDAIWWNPGEFNIPREQYIQDARDKAIMTFAILKDGQWFERGELGWWGAVIDEKNPDQWYQEFNALFDSLPDDTLLTLVDYHI